MLKTETVENYIYKVYIIKFILNYLISFTSFMNDLNIDGISQRVIYLRELKQTLNFSEEPNFKNIKDFISFGNDLLKRNKRKRKTKEYILLKENLEEIKAMTIYRCC